MALPVTISGVSFLDTAMGKCGPFLSGGAFYAVFLDSTDEGNLDVFKATDPTDAWTQSATVDTGGASDVLAYAAVQDGTNIHIVTHVGSTTNLDYHVFAMASDSFSTSSEDVGVAAGASTSPPWVDIAVRSDGDIVVTFAGATETVHGAARQRASYVIKTSTTWGSEITLGGTGAATSFMVPTIVRGESDKMHMTYRDDTNADVYHKSLTSADSLSSAEAINDNAATPANGAIVRSVYYDDGGVERITTGWGDASPFHIFTSEIDDDATPGAEEDATDAAVVNSAGETVSIASMAVETKKVHLLLASTDSDLFHTTNDDSGGWDTDVEELDAISLVAISSNVYARSGTKLAYIYDDGGTIKYNEVNLGAPPDPVTAVSRRTLLGVGF